MRSHLHIFALLLLSLTCNVSLASTDSIALLTNKANQNDTQAQFDLAQSYALGVDTEKNLSTAFYWYQQAAENGHKAAQYKVAQAFELGDGTKKDLDLAIRWYTQLAIEGDVKAPLKLASLYEHAKEDISELDMAEIWYQVASDTLENTQFNTQAEDGYYRVLETKFNTQRAKQLSSMDKLDAEFEPITLEPPATSLTQTTDSTGKWSLASLLQKIKIENSKFNVIHYVPWLIIALLTLCLIVLMRKNNSKKTNGLIEQQQQLQNELKSKTFAIKQLKRQLETVFREFKKLQAATKKQKFAMACAMFGFNPTSLPDEKKIKLRFKQLSRIYHPDMKGSEEEMKRLNSALKIILQNVTNK